MPGWEAFFTAQVAASATLAGLLFVGVSLNLAKILSNSSLPNRALAGFCLLLAILLISSLMLLPGQSGAQAGAEALAIGLLLWSVVTRLDISAWRRSETQYRHHFVRNFFLYQTAVIPYLIGGVILLTGGSSGLYWVAAAIILSLLAAFFEAWVLLVEINR
jgi:hypothetical protein